MTLTLDLGTMWFSLYLKKFDFFILLSFRRVPNYKPLWISVIIHIIFSRALWLKLKLCLTSQNAALDITSPGYPQSYLTCSGVSRRTKKVQNVHHCCAVYITSKQTAPGALHVRLSYFCKLQTALDEMSMPRGTRVNAASGQKEGEATGSPEGTLQIHSPLCCAQSCTPFQLFLRTAHVSEVTFLQKLFDK